MNINMFFILVSLFLITLLYAFKPLDIKQQKFVDVPQFNLLTFTMHELNDKGLVTLMNGTEGTKYSDRYEIKDIDYTDNSKEYIANMVAKDGIYKSELVTLTGDVVYSREDGLTFETQKATYDKKTAISRADGDYILYRSSDIVTGKKLKYNNINEKIVSKNVTAKYQIIEGKKYPRQFGS